MNEEPRDFIHYLPRRVVMKFPKMPEVAQYREGAGLMAGFERPVQHITRQRYGAVTHVQPGDRIWMVSQLFSPWGHLPPGLDACIVVASATQRQQGGYCFMAASASRWLPMVDACSLLLELKTVNAKGDKSLLWQNPDKPIGHSLQSMRQLDSARLLTDWERRLEALPLHFISYRIADGSRLAFEKVRELLGEGRKVFWDRWGLPRRLAERRETVSDSALDGYLMQQLRRASSVWGIESPLYHEPDAYAQRECTAARHLGIYIS